MRRFVLIAFFLEVGFLLAVVPWTPFWDRNYFAQWLPWLQSAMTNPFVRGGVSGLGVVNVVAALGELISAVLALRRPSRLKGDSAPGSGSKV